MARTVTPCTEPRELPPLGLVVDEATRRAGHPLDLGRRSVCLAFVPDGEPTLDAHLGEAIDRPRDLGMPIAVITNGSLRSRAEVRDALGRADRASVAVDSGR